MSDETIPSYYEEETRKMVDKLEKKVDKEIEKIESRNSCEFETILDRIDQLHERNTNKLQVLENSIDITFKEFARGNEKFKNATSQSIEKIYDELSKRLPLWTTFLISLLVGALSVAVAGIFALLKGLI